MISRPILFSAPMVRALLEGRKTQTRRAVKDVFAHRVPALGRDMDCVRDLDGAPSRLDIAPRNWELCPYGVPGDLLWVRETWCTIGDDHRCDDLPPSRLQPSRVWYEADGEPTFAELTGKTRVSIHMPRWASRLTLRITDVRVELLNAISEADAIAEGAEPLNGGMPVAFDEERPTARNAFIRLWRSINGPGSWDANPWAWTLSFEVIKRNVDDVLNEAS